MADPNIELLTQIAEALGEVRHLRPRRPHGDESQLYVIVDDAPIRDRIYLGNFVQRRNGPSSRHIGIQQKVHAAPVGRE